LGIYFCIEQVLKVCH